MKDLRRAVRFLSLEVDGSIVDDLHEKAEGVIALTAKSVPDLAGDAVAQKGSPWKVLYQLANAVYVAHCAIVNGDVAVATEHLQSILVVADNILHDVQSESSGREERTIGPGLPDGMTLPDALRAYARHDSKVVGDSIGGGLEAVLRRAAAALEVRCYPLPCPKCGTEFYAPLPQIENGEPTPSGYDSLAEYQAISDLLVENEELIGLSANKYSLLTLVARLVQLAKDSKRTL